LLGAISYRMEFHECGELRRRQVLGHALGEDQRVPLGGLAQDEPHLILEHVRILGV
jgi:hypothetical protein